jgi:transposase-like protein
MDLKKTTGRYLCFREREEIAIMRAQGAGVREIARAIGRAPSTISRELRRNAATRGGKLEYRASVAQWKADLVAQRPKAAKLVVNEHGTLRRVERTRCISGLKVLDPRGQRPVADAERLRYLGPRSIRAAVQRHRFTPELLGVLRWTTHPGLLPLGQLPGSGVQEAGSTPLALSDSLTL